MSLSLITENASLTHRNTLGLECTARYYAEAQTEEDVREALAFARDRQLPVMVLGGGSNTVLPRKVDALVLGVNVTGIQVDGTRVEAGAGENWHGLVLQTLDRQRFGLENLSLIPGLAGAAPIQNIGAYGVELDRFFVGLDAIDRRTLETVVMGREDCRFGYRDSIFKHDLKDRLVIVRIRLSLADTFAANLDYDDLRAEVEAAVSGTPTAKDVSDAVCRVRRRKLPDPVETGNAGSFFKNPEVDADRFRSIRQSWPDLPAWQIGGRFKLSAAWMIEHLGLKGSRVGDASVSTRHALVLVNDGRATQADILGLADRVRNAVKERFDLDLEIEPVIYRSG